MVGWRQQKVRSDETWAEVRRAWEAGETGASLARRYDVGLANLWRRRAAEGWEREGAQDRPPEPLEGWERYAQGRLDAFQMRRDEVRLLALTLLGMLEGGRPETAPTWHIGWLFRERARRLGPEVAAADREWARGREWAEAVWDEAGEMRGPADMDLRFLRLWREDWRAEQGLPPGAAPYCPCPP